MTHETARLIRLVQHRRSGPGRSRASIADIDRCQMLARAAAQRLGEASVVHLLDPGDTVPRTVAIAHATAAAARLLRDMLTDDPGVLLDAFSWRVLQTGRPVSAPILSAELLRLWTRPAYAVYLRRFPTTSILAVPLRAEGRPVGVLRLWRERSNAPYTAADELFAQSLADQFVFRGAGGPAGLSKLPRQNMRILKLL